MVAWTKWVFAVSGVLDLLCVLVLCVASSCWSFSLDCGGPLLCMALMRLVLLPAVLLLAKHSKQNSKPLEENAEEQEEFGESADRNDDDDDEIAELLVGAPPPPRASSRVLAWWIGLTREWKKRVSIGVVFGACCCSQLMLGVQCIFLREKLVIQLFSGFLMVLVNLELFVGRKIVDELLKAEEVLCPKSHQHPLQFRTTGFVRCDRCHNALKGSANRVYSCNPCDWDVCEACLKKDMKDKASLEQAEEMIGFKEYLQSAFGLVKPQAGLLAAALIVVILRQACSTSLPSFTGTLLDLIGKKVKDASEFRKMLTWFVAVSAALCLLAGASKLLFLSIKQRMELDLKLRLYRRFLSQPISFFDKASTGDLMARLSDDSQNMLYPVRYTLSSIVQTVLGTLAGVFFCVRLSFRLTMLSVAILGPLTMITSLYSSWASSVWSRAWGIQGSITDSARESFSLIRTIRNNACEHRALQTFEEKSRERFAIGMTDAWASGGSALVAQILEVSLQTLVLAYGGLAIGADLSVGALVSFQIYWGTLSSGFQNVFDQIGEFSKASGAAQRVLGVLERLPPIDLESGVRVAHIGEVAVRNVSFSYPTRAGRVLKDVSCTLQRGKVTAVVGPSGSGKSTLVAMLCGAYEPEEGQIVVDQRELRTLHQRSYRRLIGVVEQDTALFNESIEFNICFGVEEYTQEQLVAAAKAAACDFIFDLPEKFQTKVGERGIRLSGGQKQRIAIARVLMKNPELLLLDEATSALDAESEAAVQESIDRLLTSAERPIVLLVAHRLSTVMQADCILVLRDGVVAERGTHEELLRLGGVYARLVARQMQRQHNLLDADAKPLAIDDLFTDKGDN